MSKSLVCICNMVTEDEILALLKNGARSTVEIQMATKAGTSCGKCLMTIDRMVELFLEHQPANPQRRIEFNNK